MGLSLFAACSPETEELLAGVAPGTAARLDAFDQAVADQTLRFSFSTLQQLAVWYGDSGLFDYADAVACERSLDPDLERLHAFRCAGWGRPTSAVRRLLATAVSHDGQPQCVTDPADIRDVLAAQSLSVPPSALSGIAAVFCG